MPQTTETSFDAASALILGGRKYQEDAVVADFPIGCETGVIVLSDGMGGHAAGDVASKIVMTEVFCELKFQSGSPETFTNHTVDILQGAMMGANDCISAHIQNHPDARGMGATLLAAVFHCGQLNWISVGDSPLYLYRDGMLRQLNEDHSMAPQIDKMVDSGMIDRETAMDHPDRNALTSVLAGDPVSRIDCPEEPFELRNGDIVIAASDGLQFLEDNKIASLLRLADGKPSARVTQILLDEISKLGDPDQDNTSIVLVRVSRPEVQDDVTDAVRSAFSFAMALPEDEEPEEDQLETLSETTVEEPEVVAEATPEVTVADLEEDPAEEAIEEADEASPEVLADDGQEEIDEASRAKGDSLETRIAALTAMLPEQEYDSLEDLAEPESFDSTEIAEPEHDPDVIDEVAEAPILLKAEEPDEAETRPVSNEIDDDSENIFDAGGFDEDEIAEADGELETGDDGLVQLFDEEDPVEPAEASEDPDAVTVSMRTEPRNERRPGAPILRRIVVEASR